MNIKTGQELKKYIELKIKDKYQRSYVDYFYHKLLNEKFYYVLYGFRRIGKSTLCFQILDKFITNNIYCVNEIGFIDIELEISLGNTVNNIKQYIFEIIKQNKIKLLFLDEIQIIEDWDLFLKSLHDHFNNVKIICTGSSSYKLKQKESGIGRFIRFNILPISLNEFIDIKKINTSKISKKEIIQKYLNETCFFELWDIHDNDLRKKYMIEIIEKTITQDLLSIVNRSFTSSYMKQIIREIAISETGELSFDKIQSKYSIPKTTFYEYIDILQNIGVIHILDRYNKNLELSKRGPNKYYLSLPFLYQLYLEDQNVFHKGKILESLFLMNLNKKINENSLSTKISYIRDKQGEIDFYIPDSNIAYELKSNTISFNDLHIYLSKEKSLDIKIINIDELFNMLIAQ